MNQSDSVLAKLKTVSQGSWLKVVGYDNGKLVVVNVKPQEASFRIPVTNHFAEKSS